MTVLDKYSVFVSERIKAILGEGLDDVGNDETLEYSWHQGYEKLSFKNAFGGGIEYAGVYHPGNGCCETGDDSDTGVCIYCGRTMM